MISSIYDDIIIIGYCLCLILILYACIVNIRDHKGVLNTENICMICGILIFSGGMAYFYL